jgi:hypothetical protein
MRHLYAPLVLLMLSASAMAQVQVIVRPEESDQILANPGMGWQTFHRTSRQDKNLPDWIPSTIHYARWGWGQVEPRPGQIDHAFLDGILRETRESGQKLAFRVMCASTYKGRPYHPAWLMEVGGREIIADYDGVSPLPVPDLDDPVTLERHLDLIRRLGQRYDGHADLDHIDLGTVGWWGEWHMSSSKVAKMPTPENRRKIVDAYLAAFTKTPVIMLVGGGEDLTYAAGRGAGWRADCLGDLGGFSKTWCHMRKGYPSYIRKAGIEDAWKMAPVAWESCWDMRKWVGEGWSLRYIFNYALACNGSYLNNKSAPLPEGPEVRAEVERFLRRLGYRLVLRELAHPSRVEAGQALEISMKWQNMGSAPCYRPYRLAYRLTDEAGRERVLPGQVVVNRWMPGSMPLFTEQFMKEPPDLPPGEVVDAGERIVLPADLAPGAYTLSIGVLNEQGAGPPIVMLGIKGRDKDGWYPLSRVEVQAR